MIYHRYEVLCETWLIHRRHGSEIAWNTIQDTRCHEYESCLLCHDGKIRGVTSMSHVSYMRCHEYESCLLCHDANRESRSGIEASTNLKFARLSNGFFFEFVLATIADLDSRFRFQVPGGHVCGNPMYVMWDMTHDIPCKIRGILCETWLIHRYVMWDMTDT